MSRSILIAVIIVLFVASSFSQNSYKVVFEGPKHETINRILSKTQDGFIVNRFHNHPHSRKAHLSDIYTFDNNDPADTIHWELDFNRPDTALTVGKLYCEPDGEYVILGTGSHYTDTDTLIIHSRFNWMMRLDAMKNLIWEKFYPYPDELGEKSTTPYFQSLALSSGNYLIAETVRSDSLHWLLNILLLELSTQGEVVKTKLFDRTISGHVESLSYNFDSSAVLLHKASWELYDCLNGIGAFILDTANYDTIGRVCYRENGKGFARPFNVMLNPDGDLIVAGTYDNWSSSQQTFVGIQRFDTSYQITHEIMLTDPDTTTYAAWVDCVDINEQGEICVAGSFDNALGIFTTHYDLIYLAKLDPELSLISERYIGRDAEYSVFSMVATSDGGIAVGGYQYDYMVNEDNEADPFIIKTDAGLWLDTPQHNEVNVHRALVYPNPGNNELHIRTTVKQAVFCLFNLNGNLLLEESLGQLTTTINTSSLAQGAYWWTVSKQDQVADRGKWIKY